MFSQPHTRGAVVTCFLIYMVVGASFAHAVDGVIEINQDRAITGGITPGDAPGFPVTLSQSGSYVLTGDLSLPDENTDGIEATATGVSIDMNGFAVRGVSDQMGPSGSGVGISGSSGLVVKDGTVEGTGSTGISAGGSSRLENLRIHNCEIGLEAATHSQVLRVAAIRNRGRGMEVGPRAIVRSSVVNSNLSDGIRGFSEVMFVDNVVTNNAGYGIEAGDNCLLRNNNVIDNSGRGLGLADGCSYGGNVLRGNNGGNSNSQVGTAGGAVFELGINVCGTSTSCP